MGTRRFARHGWARPGNVRELVSVDQLRRLEVEHLGIVAASIRPRDRRPRAALRAQLGVMDMRTRLLGWPAPGAGSGRMRDH